MDPTSPPDRREAILKAARICFLDRGFVRTTISEIVALSGGSRSTVYEEFGSKEGLFKALVSSIIEQMRLPDVPNGPPAQVLRGFGVAYMERLMDPEALALYRVALGESAHVRHLGPALFEAGQKSATAALAGRIRGWVRDGILDVDDPDRAASLFLAMVEGDLHRSAVLWASTPGAADIAANVDFASDLFIRGAGAPLTRR
jgi:TetR/AcrR family transcriptional repressor of mexJK operon